MRALAALSGATLLAGFATLAAAEAAEPAVAVRVGGEPDLDACGSSGRVAELDPRGGDFLALRAGPGRGYAVLDRLAPGQALALCDERGDWLGVVYGRSPDQDCGVGSPRRDRTAYAGPCRSGWVFRVFVRFEAG